MKALKKRADVVSCDCTFLWEEAAPDARHMGLKEAARTAERLRRAGVMDDGTKFVLTHFSYNSRPSQEAVERAEREYGFIAAYDGMTLEI